MKLLSFCLLPLAGFACGWIFGTFYAVRPVQAVHDSQYNTALSTAVWPNPSSDGALRSSQPNQPLPQTEPTPRVDLHTALSYPSELHRIAAFTQILDSTRPEQLTRLHSEFLATETPPSSNLLRLLFYRWAKVAPEQALEATTKNWRNGIESSYHTVLKTWGESDPASLLSYAQKLPLEERKTLGNIEEFAFPQPGSLPPLEAVRRIQELQVDAELSHNAINAIGAIFREWAKNDPDAAWLAALALPGRGQEQRVRECALVRVFESQIAKDPVAAAQLIGTFPVGDERTKLQNVYVYSLVAGKKFSHAKSYALALPEGQARREALSMLAEGLVERNKEEAYALVMNLPATDLQDPTLFTNFFRQWMRTEPQRASEFLLSQIAPHVQGTEKQVAAYAQIFTQWAVYEPQATSEFLLKLPKGVRGTALEKALAIFCENDYAGVTKWAAGLPYGPDRDAVMYQVGTSLAERGVTEVTNWVNQLPSDSGKFAAIEGFTRTIVSVSPDDALAWLRTVPHQAERLERLTRVWSSWKDRDAAQQWRDTSPALTATERAALK